MPFVGRPERVISLAKRGRAVSEIPVKILLKLFEECLEGSIHIRWNITWSLRPPSCPGIDGGDALKGTGPGCKSISWQLHKLGK